MLLTFCLFTYIELYGIIDRMYVKNKHAKVINML